ncbi:MAG: hypothetical protein ACRDJY_04940, partial [Thermoleophilaceae bacterium]
MLRAWREPLPGAQDGALWTYVVEVGPDADELLARTGIASRLWVELREPWTVEVVVAGGDPPPYQAAALAAAREIWSA